MSSTIAYGSIPAAVPLATNTPAYQASGLASGLNDSSIIASMVSSAQLPLNLLQQNEANVQTQLSSMAQISSSVSALATAAASLADGVAAVSANTNTTSFEATADATAQVGTYSVQVTSLASAAKALSGQFGSATSGVTGGTLTLDVQGNPTPITITDGESLTDVATAINQSGAGVAAAVLSTGSGYYLSLTNSETGYPVGSDASSGLSITETTTGTQGQALGLAVTKQAVNAGFTVDGLPFSRSTNTVSDALPGVTFTLDSSGGPAENLQLSTSVSGTQSSLQTFCDAYNTLIQQLNAQLAPAVGTNPAIVLQGDATLENLQRDVQGLVTAKVPGLANVSSLAAAGITTALDGTLSINTKVLQLASANPSQLNALFQTATTGISALTKSLSTQFTQPIVGALAEDQAGLQSISAGMANQVTLMQANITAYQKQITDQFTAMETTVGNFKNIGSYLTALSAAETAASSPNG